MLKLCQLCFMLRPCDYAIFDAGIIRSTQRQSKTLQVRALGGGQAPAGACGRQLHLAAYLLYLLTQRESGHHRWRTSILVVD